MKRTKTYYLKEITSDGLIKDAKDQYGGLISYGESSEKDCWAAIEAVAKQKWNGSRYCFPVEYIVVCEWSVSMEKPE